jgi:transposase
MAIINRYFRFSKISEARFRCLLRCFALDLTATQAARMTGISVRSVNPIFLRLRKRLARECRLRSPFAGELEADESYFGPRRVRGRRGRGAGRKIIVFGLLKRGDKVYTEIRKYLSAMYLCVRIDILCVLLYDAEAQLSRGGIDGRREFHQPAVQRMA